MSPSFVTVTADRDLLIAILVSTKRNSGPVVRWANHRGGSHSDANSITEETLGG